MIETRGVGDPAWVVLLEVFLFHGFIVLHHLHHVLKAFSSAITFGLC